MISRSVLRGYLLEEALAWLLRHSGYRLLVSAAQDPAELVGEGSATLRVRGRGGLHQVDVLGEFAYTPAFSLPIRLFLEAKHYATSCRLEVVRNAHGVIYDVNENFVHVPGRGPRRRYHYSYALFSASGFTADAQQYALAHQISLVDLSGDSFSWLRECVRDAAYHLWKAALTGAVSSFPVSWMRLRLRTLLRTAPSHLLPKAPTPAPHFRTVAGGLLADFASALTHYGSTELLLGFPAAPFILPLAAQRGQDFLDFAETRPAHHVQLRRTGLGEQAEWAVSPVGSDAYRLTFKLPDHVEAWIEDIDEDRYQRTLKVKEDFLARITVYRMGAEGVRSYQLLYEPQALRRQRSGPDQSTLP